MIKSKIDKSFYILGLGISGLSTALFLKKKSKKVICWDDDNEKRKLAIENKLNVKKINPGEMKLKLNLIGWAINCEVSFLLLKK